MKIKIKSSEELVEILAIVWEEINWGGTNPYFLGYHRKSEKLLKYSYNVKVIDAKLGVDFIFFKNGLYYRPLIEDELLNGLLEMDKLSYEKLNKALKHKSQWILIRNLDIKISYRYISELVSLSWQEIMYGIKYRILTSSTLMEHIYNLINVEQEPSYMLLDMASLVNEEEIFPYVKKLMNMEKKEKVHDMWDKFMYVTLNWLFNNKEKYPRYLEIINEFFGEDSTKILEIDKKLNEYLEDQRIKYKSK